MQRDVRRSADGGLQKTSRNSAQSTEMWAAAIVLSALGILILLRLGFRGVSFMGASARIG